MNGRFLYLCRMVHQLEIFHECKPVSRPYQLYLRRNRFYEKLTLTNAGEYARSLSGYRYVPRFLEDQIYQSDDHVRAIVLHGRCDAFIGEYGKRASFLSHIADSDSEMDDGTCYKELLALLATCTKTLVCAISGHVSGGSGLEVIMSCDYRITTQASEFGGTQDLSQTFLSQATSVSPWEASGVGKRGEAMNKLLSGESISAEDAKQMGLVDELLEDDSEILKMCSVIGCKNGKRTHFVKDSKFKKLLYYLPDQFLMYRTSQLFNLIRDFPESTPILEELRTALRITSQYEYVIGSIRKQLQERLLIPGAHTEDVLQMYLRTHKVTSFLFKDSGMRTIDVFLKVANAVIEHLQKRSDSVKCIVSSLLDDSQDVRTDLSLEEDELLLDSESVADDPTSIEAMLQWTPGDVTAARSESDTMSLLIGVYGGKESFLSEYRDMLASRLISIGSFDIDRETASLDLMKSKFVSSQTSDALTHCSVMIKDVTESRKLNLKIRSKLIPKRSGINQISMLVKSAHFWPNSTVADDNDGDSASSSLDQFAYLPKSLLDLMREHERLFTELKPTQKIQWCRHEGVVTLSIEIRGKEVEFRLSPLYVEVLALFQNIVAASPAATPVPAAIVAPTLSLEEIARAVKESRDRVKPVVQFWVSKNVIREQEINKFVINE